MRIDLAPGRRALRLRSCPLRRNMRCRQLCDIVATRQAADIPAGQANGKKLACDRAMITREIAMKRICGLLLSLGIAVAPGVLHAQGAWPNRAITFVVPYGAGGYTDLVA